jgi:hypothetical protein
MLLTRGQMFGYDSDRMIFKFTMMNEARIVDCEISSVALDDLDGEKGTRPGEREAQFKRLRDEIERITSGIFDERGKNQKSPAEVVRIFAKHVRNR